MAKSEKNELSKTLIISINEIASISDYRTPVKKHCSNLSRRLQLLLPMLEEIRDSKESVPDEVVKALSSLKASLLPAKDLLTFVGQVSKIYLVLERDQIMLKFQKVTAQLEQALSGIPYENLEISDELKEQVELVLIQLRRAIGRGSSGDTYEDELYRDVLTIYSNCDTGNVTESEIVRRVAEKLRLMTITDLTQESWALLEMVSSSSGDPGESFEKMSMVLKKIKDFVQTDNPNLDHAPVRQKPTLYKLQYDNEDIPLPPEDFRCPISLELMTDPVIVSSGQTYERDYIKKWLEGGHSTCPKTQEKLTSDTVTPNYALRSLIAQWCEANGIEPPKRPNNSQPSSKASSSSSTPADEQNKIEELLLKLTSQFPEEQRSAAGEIRLLAKRNNHNRVTIAASGAIPLLVNLLTVSDDFRTQEHAVTSILNLSICEENKGRIVSTGGAVPGIVHVLKKGSMEARENAAATLFSLSVIDENKVTIGSVGAIPPLVTLLSEGSRRGKKDAATALFNLCIFQGNKGKAVRAGLVPVLMRLLTESESGMVDEALAILAILSSHPEGKSVVGGSDAVPVLVDFVRSGSPRNKENAAAVLVHLCSWNQQHLFEAQKLGIMGLLMEMAENGTDRGKRKAAQLLSRFSRFSDQQKESGSTVEDQVSLI